MKYDAYVQVMKDDVLKLLKKEEAEALLADDVARSSPRFGISRLQHTFILEDRRRVLVLSDRALTHTDTQRIEAALNLPPGTSLPPDLPVIRE